MCCILNIQDVHIENSLPMPAVIECDVFRSDPFPPLFKRQMIALQFPPC